MIEMTDGCQEMVSDDLETFVSILLLAGRGVHRRAAKEIQRQRRVPEAIR